MVVLLIFFFELFFIAPAQAVDLGNPGFAPTGGFEGLLGNAGTTVVGSPTAVFYNPGSVRALPEWTLAANAQILSLGFWTLQNADVVEESSVNTLVQIPSLVLSRNFSPWNASISLLAPGQSEFVSQFVASNNGKPVSTIMNRREQEHLLGFSVNRLLDEKLSIGFSIFFQRYSEFESVVTRQIDATNVSDFLDSQISHRRVLGVYGVVGATYQWNENWIFASRIQVPQLRISGQASVFTAAKGTNKNQVLDAENTELLKANQEVPWDFTFGANYTRGKHSGYVDLGLQFASDFRKIDGNGAEPSKRLVTNNTLRMHTGYRFKWNEKMAILAGFQYNPSAIAGNELQLDFLETLEKDHQDFWSLSAGISLQTDLAEVVAGAFYSHGDLTVFNEESPFDSAIESTTRAVGVILGASHRF